VAYQVMKGYLNNSGATLAAIKHDRLFTDDLGREMNLYSGMHIASVFLNIIGAGHYDDDRYFYC